ncbi:MULTISPECIES: adenosylcobinamide-GDP ribazoletransferase [unclassified Novosphingobium]|uniref:adenosylcobinamide-GDP ribazoletransferase n=1 Tax=unclassified Novosphingobium TaxID=2644732 RepID=UPI000F5EE9C5|nr:MULTISPECIES: adenosylcobinamide-GDP ribazoletransferase [unclassified Novosphingobium]MBF5092630.1 adenosylcobinamide-GDP ribazoletransferase [Novosphingobium sp. NBM11]RQW45087.1 adenosylcobinamide-GDP ribazoletransferase [Novosphingobium sp. LASN5T]
MRPCLLALQFLTRLPLPVIPADEADFGRAIRWFPAAGLVVGSAVAAAAWLGLHRDPWLAALLALAAWIAITGALHLDGLGDIADAAGAAHQDRARVSAVLADPHIGSFGVVAIGLQVAAKLVLLHLALTVSVPPALLLVPVLARLGPIAWAITLPPLHAGMGTLFRAGATGRVFAVWLACLAFCACLTNAALLLVLGLVPLWAWWLRARIGGLSGDGHGAGIELLETAGLLVLAVTG